MTKHQWVRIVITPIQVVADAEISAEPVIFTSEDDEVEAKECAQYGCIRCDSSLTSKTIDQNCGGDDEEFDETLQNFKDQPWTDKP